MSEGITAGKEVTARKSEDKELALFRQEALEHQKSQWLGTVLLAPGISHTLFAAFAAISSAAILCLLMFSDYTRKEKVTGWLVPEQGVVRVFSPQQSVITAINVKEGDFVSRDQVLIEVSTETRNTSGDQTQSSIIRELIAKEISLRTERRLTDAVHNADEEALSQKIKALEADLSLREEELSILRDKVEHATEDFERLDRLQNTGAISGRRLAQVKEEQLNHLSELRSFEREFAAVKEEKVEREANLRAAPLRRQMALAQLDRSASEVRQQLAEAEARRGRTITAPQSGIVTALQIELGGSVSPDIPLLTILPEGSVLQAELFIPSKARGLIKTGQIVSLRYQAFPYQRFGQYKGEVSRVSKSAITPSELVRQHQSTSRRESTQEPVYPATVKLERQSAIAYGEPIDLQPGMQVEAHIEIEKRRLIEWVLSPLFKPKKGVPGWR